MPPNTRREKKRYIAFKIQAPREITRKEFIGAIRQGVKDDKQWEDMKPWLTVFQDNFGILRCFHRSKDEAIALLTSIKRVGREGIPISVTTLATSGNIRKAKRKINSGSS